MSETSGPLLVLLGLALIASPGPCFAQQVRVPEADKRSSGEEQYVIGPDDLLDIVVWNNTVISRAIPVRPDGKISLPLLNDVQAAGLTPMELRETLTKALGKYIPVPEVSVIVREVHSFKVSVIGQVKTPGRYELTSRVTVLDMLAIAGGLNEYAARARIVVLRRQGAVTKQIPFAYDKLTARNGSANGSPDNFFVQPGDIILVP